jgi:hypothetical protein
MPAGGLARQRMYGLEAVYAGPKTFTAGMLGEAIDAGLHPFGSPPTVAKGTLKTTNIVEDLFGARARLMSPEERPLQFLRGEWGATEAAKLAAPEFKGEFGKHFSRLEPKIMGPEYERLLYGGEAATSARAYTAPQLMTLYVDPKELEAGKIGRRMFQEEIIFSPKTAKFMEYERVIQKKVALDEGFRTNQSLLDALKGKRIGELQMLENPIGSGQFLGVERGTGRELWSLAGKAEAEVIAAQLSGDETATLFMRERHRLGSEYWKLFGEDIKFMGKINTEAQMEEILRRVGAPASIAGQEVEAAASAKLIMKRRAARITQQTSAMAMFTGWRMDVGRLPMAVDKKLNPAYTAALEFLKDPAKTLKLDLLMAEGVADAEFQIQKNMVALSKRFGFSEAEMRLTFGFMPEEAAKKLGIFEILEAAPRKVIGVSGMRLGDLASEGVGGMAKLEQTGFRLLAMKGEEGQRFAAEMATRVTGKTEGRAADRMVASMIGAEGLGDKAKQFIGKAPMDTRTLAQFQDLDDLLRPTGRYVDIGQKVEAFGGASRIYIPGTVEAGELFRPIPTQAGKVIPSELGRGLEDLRRAAQGGVAEEIEYAAQRLCDRAFITAEQQAAATGHILGSRSFTPVRQTAALTDDTFRIGTRRAEEMFDDLIDRAKSADQREYLRHQKALLIEKEQTLIGGLWRHPTTGPESFQVVRYRVDKSLADDIITVPYKMGRLTKGGKIVDLSQMVGPKVDFDKDTVNLAVIGNRDTASRLAKKMDGEIQKNYTRYLFNHYSMKDWMEPGEKQVKALTQMTHAEAVKAGAMNLTAVKMETGQVNLALQKLKLGLQHTAPEKYRPMAELFMLMEEAAIGSKHGALESSLYQGIGHAVQNRDISSMESVIKQLTGGKDLAVSERVLMPGGGTEKMALRLTAREAATEAIGAATAAGEDVEWAVKAAQAVKGRIPKGANEAEVLSQMTTMFYKRRTGSLDMAQSLMGERHYGAEGFTQRANRALRRASTKGTLIKQALSKAKAPLMIGAAVAAGVMLAAPSVSGAIPNKEGPAGGRNLGFSDLGPPAGMGMSPPAARIMASPKAYDMSGIKTSSRANIRMSMPDADRASPDFMRQARTLAAGSNVRVRTVDDRHALNPHRLASKIHERL